MLFQARRDPDALRPTTTTTDGTTDTTGVPLIDATIEALTSTITTSMRYGGESFFLFVLFFPPMYRPMD